MPADRSRESGLAINAWLPRKGRNRPPKRNGAGSIAGGPRQQHSQVNAMTEKNGAIGPLYSAFEDALTEVLAENEFGPARRTRLFEARMKLQAHPNFQQERYRETVDRAFRRWGGPG